MVVLVPPLEGWTEWGGDTRGLQRIGGEHRELPDATRLRSAGASLATLAACLAADWVIRGPAATTGVFSLPTILLVSEWALAQAPRVWRLGPERGRN